MKQILAVWFLPRAVAVAVAATLVSTNAAQAQTPGSPQPGQPPIADRGAPPRPTERAKDASSEQPWYVDFSLVNAFDGNINHDPEPVRSYGLSPTVAFRYERPALEWGYDIALNNYSHTDEWDRLSQGLYGVVRQRLGRFRFETGGDATWKGSSEDRELSNEFGISERVLYKLTDATRIAVTGAYRYKQYPDDPGTSGVSPYVSTKFDHRFGDQRLVVGYKYQTRLSQTERDRYRRHVYDVEFSMPIDLPADQLSFELEFRPQAYYQRLIRVEDSDVREIRQDRRILLAASYERPISPSVNVIWLVGFEQRDSNDTDKRYSAPSFAMTFRYRWRQ
jgi:hypothetical protein